MGGNYSVPVYRGARPKPKRRVGRWVMAIALGLGLAYILTRPVMRLRSDPPAGFFEVRRDWDAKRRAAEEQLARAYWETALNSVQWRYSYGTSLPDNPPPEFKLEEKSWQGGVSEPAAATRARYWRQLRRVWVSPQTWEKSYEWDTERLRRSLLSLGAMSKRAVESLLRNFRT